jgi:hypothetical protein
MGIEPTGNTLPELENKPFRANANAKCDWRVNFRGMWGNARLCRDTSMSEIPGSCLSAVGLRTAYSVEKLSARIQGKNRTALESLQFS